MHTQWHSFHLVIGDRSAKPQQVGGLVKKILMIAYHFPPLAGSSGIQRTLRFVQHLPFFGWQPLVLSAHPLAYERTSDDMLKEVPEGTVVRRAFALDCARHLQLGGRYFGWMARPDRWISWKFDAIRAGLQLIDAFKPDVIWSTYPIATAHVIASRLHRKTGIPWVADFRDPMAHDGFPADPRTWQSYLAIEADAIALAHTSTFTTPGAARMYQHRYPGAAGRMVVLENGYDEESFLSAESSRRPVSKSPKAKAQPLVLLHSGIIYPLERDPTQLFVALGRLKRAGLLVAGDLCVRLRAAVHEDLLKALAETCDVQDMIELLPAITYLDALAEMMAVDALLVMQASNCNAQIPAKIYEYLRAGKPILGLTDPEGDTAAVLQKAGIHSVARLDSADEIAVELLVLVAALKEARADLPNPIAVQSASRKGRAESLAQLLNQVTHQSVIQAGMFATNLAAK